MVHHKIGPNYLKTSSVIGQLNFSSLPTGTLHERGAFVDELASTSTRGETVAAEAFGGILCSCQFEPSSSTTLSTSLNGVVLRRVEQSREETTIGAFCDNAIRSPADGELYSGWRQIRIVVPVDGVGSTADLIRVASTWHLAFARQISVFDVFKGAAVAFVSVL